MVSSSPLVWWWWHSTLGPRGTEVFELHAAKAGFDISDAHPMEPVARALGLLATSGDLTSYAGRFMPFDQIHLN